MTAFPLDELAAAARPWGADLDAEALGRLERYLASVRARNAEVNLTADDEPRDLALKHAADGVFAACVLRESLAGRDEPRVADLGSGGGLVGIPLKIAWPQAEVTLIEAVERKFRFLSAAAAETGLRGLRALRRRAGDGSRPTAYDSGFDAVVERALAPLPEAVTLAFPLLGPRGLFAAFQSDDPDASDPALARALAASGARLLECRRYRRPGEDRDRRLCLFARATED